MWGRDVIRVHCVPFNPRSSIQQINRFRFRFISRVGVGSLDAIIKPYWNMFDVFNNGFNIFVKLNMSLVNYELEFSSLMMTVGNYEPVASINFIKYKDVNGRCMFKWSDVITRTGSPDDKIILILIDWHKYKISQDMFYVDCYINTEKVRSDSVGFILPSTELDVDFLEGYISVVGDGVLGSDTLSISKYKKVVSF